VSALLGARSSPCPMGICCGPTRSWAGSRCVSWPPAALDTA